MSKKDKKAEKQLREINSRLKLIKEKLIKEIMKIECKRFIEREKQRKNNANSLHTKAGQ